MGEQSKIEWTDHTFNPWEGCQKVAPECDNCYAESRDQRFTGGVHWGPRAPRRRTSAQNWNKPRRWNAQADAFHATHGRRQRLFCASLADVFDNAVDPAWRDDLWTLIRECGELDWLLLTKRPQNIKKMLPSDWGDGWSHVWLGTSAGTQKTADQNIPHLLAVPAGVRFLSAEPLLGPVDLEPYISSAWTTDDPEWPKLGNLDWVIVGGESGPNARPMHPDWARSLRDQCNAAGVAFHFKQWGEWAPTHPWPSSATKNTQRAFWHDACGLIFDTLQNPDGLDFFGEGHVLRVGKARAGRLLDGREWNELPQ